MSKPRVLVVDDEIDTLNLLKMLLEVSGFEPITTLNSVEAIQLAEVESPDVVLLDIMMPRLDGFALCKMMRQHPELKTLPIIFVTAYTALDLEDRRQDAGADEVIPKPIDMDKLTETIHRVRQEKNGGSATTPTALETSPATDGAADAPEATSEAPPPPSRQASDRAVMKPPPNAPDEKETAEQAVAEDAQADNTAAQPEGQAAAAEEKSASAASSPAQPDAQPSETAPPDEQAVDEITADDEGQAASDDTSDSDASWLSGLA